MSALVKFAILMYDEGVYIDMEISEKVMNSIDMMNENDASQYRKDNIEIAL